MKTYEAIFKEDDVDGVFGISLVQDPAMEGMFVALKKQEIQLKEIDKEQRILAGLVLEPNKPIYRNQNGEEFNIVFNNETVKDLCYAFTKNKNNDNSSIEHEESNKIEGVTFVENWIVRDKKTDTSVALGLDVEEGSWVAVMKVDNDDIWNDYIKTGKVKGFSIDAMLSLKEINLKSEINMSELKDALTGFKDDLLTALNLKKEEVVEEVVIAMGSVKSGDGSITFEYEGETPEVGGSIWVIAQSESGEATKVPVPVGDYELEGGSKLTVSEEGIIASIGEAPMEEAPKEEELESETNNPASDNSVLNQVQESIKSIMIKYAEEQDKKFADLNEKIVSLSEQPAAKAIKSRPTQKVELTSKGRILNKIRNK